MPGLNLREKAARIRGEIDQLQARLDFLHELIEEENAASIPAHRMNGHSHGSLKNAVENTVVSLPAPFSKRDVVERVKVDYPGLPFNEKSVDKPFQYLVRLGEIEVVQPSHGSSPALYKRRGHE